jgi:hypothetical protein
MFDKRKIADFRRKVNDNSYFALFKYLDNNGKNHWNLICSCMDWISVSINSIDNIFSDFEKLDINSKCMRVYTYISTIDIIWEAIQQLHRVLVNNKVPFRGESVIFTHNVCKDDNLFFKHLRAIFGAHPVKLNDDEDKRFASWPTTGIYTEYDFACILYSSNPEKEDIVVGFKFEELNEYAESRYNYLDSLSEEIDKQFEIYKESLIEIPIPKTSKIEQQLNILLNESRNRLNTDYYNSTIEELIMLFSVTEIRDGYDLLINSYRNKLIEVVDEIYSNLQAMNIDDLNTDSILNPEYDRSVQYPYSKLCDAIYGDRYALLEYAIKGINEYFKGMIELTENMSKEELLLYCKAGFYFIDELPQLRRLTVN